MNSLHEVENTQLIPKSNMLHPRRRHSMNAVGCQYLVATGGFFKNVLGACEKYDIEKDDWT